MKILIVDDKKENLYLLERMLKKIGHEVVMAENGKQALEKLHSDNFKMIISDILMPVMDGYQLCQAVRSNKEFNDILFIFYTATYVEKEDEELALKLGANKFIRKPMEPEKFIKIIKNLLQNMEISQVKPKKDNIKEEKGLFKLYSERLVNKLEQKMLALKKEIIERKKAEKALKESEARFKGIFESKLIGTFIWDANGVIIYANDVYLEMVGYSKDEILSGTVSWRDLTPPEYTDLDNKALEEIAITGVMTPIEKEYICKDGSRFPILVGGSTLPDSTFGGVSFVLDITERKKAEKEILDLARFPSENPNPVLRVTKKIVIYTNKAGEELFNTKEGCSIPTILQKDILNVFSENTKQELDLELNNRIYSFIITPIMEAEYVNIYGRDITERKKAEEKLKESEKKFRRIFEAIPDLFFLVSRDSTILEYKGKLSNLYPPPEEFLGKKMKDILPADLGKLNFEMIKKTIDTKQPQLLEYNLPINNEIHFYEARNLYFSDDKIAIFIRDITDRKNIENALKESEENYREILENIKDLYFEVDLKGNFVFFNDMIGEILGYSKSELLGMNYRNIMNKESAKKIFNVFNTVFKTNNIWRSAEFEIKTKYGKRIFLDSNIYLKYDSTGKKIGFRGLARDITERKKSDILRERFAEKLENKVKKRTKELNESLEQQKLYQEQLLKVSQFKSKFLASMSHELRTPLNSVIGFTDILLEGFYGEINEKQDHYLNNIRASAFHLLDLINKVLDISKIEEGKIELNIEEFSLNKITDQIITTLKPMYEEKKLKFEVIGLDEEKFIQADPIRFKEILYNLLNNAIKFTKEGGFRLEIAEHKDHLEFNIIDTGIGIAEEDFDLIFKEFKRVKSDYVYSVEGTGLGLSLTKKFIELHGGNISFTSKLGEGTTFTFILPKKMKK